MTDRWTCPKCGYACAQDTCPECGLREASIAEGAAGRRAWFILAAQLHAFGARAHLRARAHAGGPVAFAIVLALQIAFGVWLGYSSLKSAELICDAGMFGPTNTGEVWVAIIISALDFLVMPLPVAAIGLLLALPLLPVTWLMRCHAPVIAIRLLLLAPLGPIVTGAIGLALMLAQLSRPIRGEMIMRGVGFFRLADQSAAFSLVLAGGFLLSALVATGASHFHRLCVGRGWRVAPHEVVITVIVLIYAVALMVCAALVGRG